MIRKNNDKILFLIPALFNSGGMERIATSLMNLLVERCGQNIGIVVHCKNTESFFPLNKGIEVYSLGLTGRVKDSRMLAAKRLRKLIKDTKANTLVNVDVAMIQVAALACPHLLGCKIVTWEHFSLADANLLARWKRYFSALVSNRTVVLTQADRNRYPKLLRNRVEVISNFTQLNDLGRQSGYSKKTVLAVGRLEPVKGFDLLIKAWKFVSRQFPDWKLKIVGNGSVRQELMSQIENEKLANSIFLEGVSSNMADYYANSSLFVLSSRFEPFGLVLIEAKSFGLPIVSFDCPFGPREIVKDGEDGILVENGNVELLANAMIQMISNPDMAKKYGNNAICDFKKNWNADVVLTKWENILD